MGCYVESYWAIENAKNGSVFEFGCGNGFTAGKMQEMPEKFSRVVGIDLNEKELPKGYKYEFEKCDFAVSSIYENTKFDNVMAISAFEHVGLERINCENRQFRDDYVEAIAKKLSNMVSDGGRLIITTPFGKGRTYLTDRNINAADNWFRAESISSGADIGSGWRTYNTESLANLFPEFKIIESKVWLLDFSELSGSVEINKNLASVLLNLPEDVICAAIGVVMVRKDIK